MSAFSGVITTPLAPFGEDGRLRPELIEPFVAWQVENGVTGFFCLGTWGGFAILDSSERRRAAEAWCAAAGKHKAQTLVHIGAFAQHEAIELAKHAAGCGATAIASVIPLYYSGANYYKFDDYRKYFAAIVRESSLPLFLYNNPRTTGVLIKPGEFVSLAEAGVAGVKDGSKDPGWILEAQDTLAARGLAGEIIPGNTSAMIYGVASGLEACMSGATVCMPRLTSETFAALRGGDFKLGAALHRKLMAARRVVASFGPAAPVSYALLARMGRSLGTARAPWPTIDPKGLDRLLDGLKALGVPDVAG
ncbi:MAG: dihydrodipicolinate synthase family protein [Alphaproteobacteria bacterium]|nr:dihydrodipicolinate synthase family protein [Alphaproteobacteria bacterium]MBF0128859.1 dihydrodipicolinate synthase family protein [Alphaproteobacteria bacterium]